MPPGSKTVRETEAEAVALIVGTALGIRSSVDTTDYVVVTVMWRWRLRVVDRIHFADHDVT